MSKKIPWAIVGYGLFLAIIGLIGYLSNPEKARTALISGGTFGFISVVWGLLSIRFRWASTAALVTALFLLSIFTWRASVGWIDFFQGDSDKLTAATLISLMWIGSASLIAFLLTKRGGSSSG